MLHGFDLGVFSEMLSRREFGPIQAATVPGMTMAVLFFALTLMFLPGVFLGYASNYRIPREEFFRACGKNLWRLVRLAILFAILAGIVGGVLGGIQSALVKVADGSSYEKLPFYVQLTGIIVIFVVLTAIRIWFDLAEADVVIADQKAVRKSVGKAYRQTRTNLGRLLGAYLVISVVAVLVLGIGLVTFCLLGLLAVVIGLVTWNVMVPPASVFGAFLIGQLILLLLLATRFWQRAVAVGFYSAAMVEVPVEIPPAPVIFAVEATPQGDGI